MTTEELTKKRFEFQEWMIEHVLERDLKDKYSEKVLILYDQNSDYSLFGSYSKHNAFIQKLCKRKGYDMSKPETTNIFSRGAEIKGTKIVFKKN